MAITINLQQQHSHVCAVIFRLVSTRWTGVCGGWWFRPISTRKSLADDVNVIQYQQALMNDLNVILMSGKLTECCGCWLMPSTGDEWCGCWLMSTMVDEWCGCWLTSSIADEWCGCWLMSSMVDEWRGCWLMSNAVDDKCGCWLWPVCKIDEWCGRWLMSNAVDDKCGCWLWPVCKIDEWCGGCWWMARRSIAVWRPPAQERTCMACCDQALCKTTQQAMKLESIDIYLITEWSLAHLWSINKQGGSLVLERHPMNIATKTRSHLRSFLVLPSMQLNTRYVNSIEGRRLRALLLCPGDIFWGLMTTPTSVETSPC